MKTVQKGIINMVQQLNDIIELRKAQEKIEKELKATLKEFMGTDSMLEAGSFIVLVEDRVRTDLDRKALTVELGLEFMDKFTKISHYDILTIKPASRGDK